MPNTNAMPISIAMAKPLLRLCPWLMPMPMLVSDACV